MAKPVFMLIVSFFMFCLLTARADYLWWEAEDFSRTSFPDPSTHPYAPQAPWEADRLSGGKWLGMQWKDEETPFIEYTVSVKDSGNYDFYVRKFWKFGSFRWRFGEQNWQTVEHDQISFLDSVPIRNADNLEANWVHAGRASLTVGDHLLRIELLDHERTRKNVGFIPACFDAFVLTQENFIPRGTLKPDGVEGEDGEEWFSLNVNFKQSESKLTLLDMRQWMPASNPKDKAFPEVKGTDLFYKDSNEPIRFWGINLGTEFYKYSEKNMDYAFATFARFGVNLIRVFVPVFDERESSNAHYFYEKLSSIIALCDRYGMSYAVSFQIHSANKYDPSKLKGYNDYAGQFPYGAVFFNDYLQTRLKWSYGELMRLTQKTGTAPIFWELVNDESFFSTRFMPRVTVPDEQMQLLEGIFLKWLEKKYGSFNRAKEIWGSSYKGDNPSSLPTISMDTDRWISKPGVYDTDVIAFFVELQKDFFEKMRLFVKDTLSYNGLVAYSGIAGGEPATTLINRYVYSYGDYTERQAYPSASHTGPSASWAILDGQFYDDTSVVDNRINKSDTSNFENPFYNAFYANKPVVLSEVCAIGPSKHKGETIFLSGKFASTQGVSAVCFFGLNEWTWQRKTNKFDIFSPSVAGQFPAWSFIYRKQLLEPSSTVKELHLPSDFFLHPNAPLIPETVMNKKINDSRLPELKVGTPMAAWADTYSAWDTRYRVSFDSSDSKPVEDTTSAPPVSYDFFSSDGYYKIDHPAVIGVTGKFDRVAEHRFNDASMRLDYPSGSALLLPLDERTLKNAKVFLIQLSTEEENTGWFAPSEGMRRIDSIGGAPLKLRKPKGNFSFNDNRSFSFDAYSFDGTKIAESADTRQILFLPKVFYYILKVSEQAKCMD